MLNSSSIKPPATLVTTSLSTMEMALVLNFRRLHREEQELFSAHFERMAREEKAKKADNKPVLQLIVGAN